MKIPSAFISYSHDSQEHKKWVLDLAIRLRNSGVDAILDQWELGPGSDLPHFMEQHLAKADRILMICTEKYVEKANAGMGGVGYEKMIITADLLKKIDSNKVIPVIRQSGTHNVPTFLKSKMFLDFSRPDQFEYSFDELLRSLHNAPLFVKPSVGNNPFTPVSQTPAERTGDSLLKLIKILVEDFEAGEDYSDYRMILQGWGASRLMLDSVIQQAKATGLVTQDPNLDLRLTEKGKHYALEHRLHETDRNRLA
jgi:hypothetical protein